MTLRFGQRVAYRQEWFLAPVGPVRTATVWEVIHDEEMGSVTVRHSGGETEADELDEVWATPAPPPEDRNGHLPADEDGNERCACGAEIVYFEEAGGVGCPVVGHPTEAFARFRA